MASEHHHHHFRGDYNRLFFIAVLLNTVFVVVEAVFGIIADSLALIADAGHNLSDVLSLILAWGASVLAARKPTVRRTYGFKRATILASMLSAVLLLYALGAITWEAVGRFQVPAHIDGETVMLVAGVGVIINTLTALLFVSGRKQDLNIKAAFLHMAADAAVSLGVLIAGLTVIITGWLWLDPAVSLVIVVIILIGTLGLLFESTNLVVDAVPKGIDPTKVKKYLLNLTGVQAVHDFHIWGLSTSQNALTVHLVMPEGDQSDEFLHTLAAQLQEHFGIQHSTIQIERGDCNQSCQHIDTPGG